MLVRIFGVFYSIYFYEVGTSAGVSYRLTEIGIGMGCGMWCGGCFTCEVVRQVLCVFTCFFCFVFCGWYGFRVGQAFNSSSKNLKHAHARRSTRLLHDI